MCEDLVKIRKKAEGAALLQAIQDVYLAQEITVA